MKPKIFTNPFVRRQTPESNFSHTECTWARVCELTAENFENAKPCYREGVLEVPIPVEGVCTNVVTLTNGANLCGRFAPRRDGEDPRKELYAVLDGTWSSVCKPPAAYAAVIIYESRVLAEDGDNSQEPVEGNWEIVSLNASPVTGDMPIDPDVLMHNHFGSDGGSDTQMTDAEFTAQMRKSFWFWKDKALVDMQENS